MSWLDSFFKSKSDQAEMGFFDHIEELRWMIIRSLIAILLVAVILFLNKSFMFDDIILAPSNPHFFTFRIMCDLGNLLHVNGLCVGNFNFTITNIDLSAQFMIHLSTAFTLGLVLVFPYVLWEVWKFIAPALHDNEKRQASGVVLAGSLLFYIGVLFGYYMICPFTVYFLGTYQVSPTVLNQINLQSYIDTITGLGFACGLVFEFPLVIYFLARLGIATHTFLGQYRKYAIVAIFFIAAIITPSPDMFSQTLVALPLWGLFEVSILLSKRVTMRREARLKKEEMMYVGRE
jgi:sec-independent protein translocase protein TatC